MVSVGKKASTGYHVRVNVSVVTRKSRGVRKSDGIDVATDFSKRCSFTNEKVLVSERGATVVWYHPIAKESVQAGLRRERP